MPAIEPAISTLPVKNQLIAKVSRVPRVRQLMALRTDLECVSAPRNKATGALPSLIGVKPTMWRRTSALRLSCSRGIGPGDSASSAIGELLDLVIQLLSGAPTTFLSGAQATERAAPKAISEGGPAKRMLRKACSLPRECRKMAYFHSDGELNGLRPDVHSKPEPAGAPLILTTAFNNRDAAGFAGRRVSGQA